MEEASTEFECETPNRTEKSLVSVKKSKRIPLERLRLLRGSSQTLNVENVQMNQSVFAFRRYEDASLSYTGIESHEGLRHYGLYDTVIARDDELVSARE